jgi:hypothetical protein
LDQSSSAASWQGRAVADDEPVEWGGEQLVDAPSGGGAIREGGPADHSAQRDSIVEAQGARVEPRPGVFGAAHVVNEIGDDQGGRRSVHESAYLEPEAVDAVLVDDARVSWILSTRRLAACSSVLPGHARGPQERPLTSLQG